jgi:hypothetical protein
MLLLFIIDSNINLYQLCTVISTYISFVQQKNDLKNLLSFAKNRLLL